MAGKKPLAFGAAHFINRELSWLEFNQRVLDEAIDKRNPLLERLKFFTIVSSNLDEYFEVRVAGLKQQIESGGGERGPDGLTATEILQAVQRRVRRMVDQQYACWREDLLPDLARRGIRILEMEDLKTDDRQWVSRFYQEQVRPVLTPLAIDPAHPFPQLLNKSLNLIVELEASRDGLVRTRLAVVQVPRVLPRFVKLPRENTRQDFVSLVCIVGHYLADLFPGARILGYWAFRLTRNSELYIEEEEVANLLKAVENEVHNRRKGEAVRLEIDVDSPVAIRRMLLKTLHLSEDDLYVIDGPLNPTRLMALYEGDHSPELRDRPFVAAEAASLQGREDIFAAIRERDILLHHPFESFESVVRFLRQAAEDPDVLAIKQTLYRTGGDARIIGALMNAVKNGKQVTAVVELRARFDEANNIEWARRLEEAGVHVVYGLVGYKIHAKVALVVRREQGQIRRYIHLGTGNYNASTARLYTDIGLLTCRPDFGEDATSLFNLLTGISQYQPMRKLLIAPFELHGRIQDLIRREAENARRGLPSRIIAKMNSLVDETTICELYRASQAGVDIQLIVRGICCLRPGIRGISDRITVRSIVDRFLEHSRIFYFENASQPEVYIGSADWMPRNFFGRIEAVFPIEDGNLRERLTHDMLAIPLADNLKARELQSDGSYRQASPPRGGAARRSQFEFINLGIQKSDGHAAANGRPRHPRVTLRPPPPGLGKTMR